MGNIIITGVPRGGTTLAAAILDMAPDSLCLSEPENHVELMLNSDDECDFVDRLESEFSFMRATLISGGEVDDRRKNDGRPVTNYFEERSLTEKRNIAFIVQKIKRHGLSENFLLGIKHNALYTAVLPEIVRRHNFKIIVIVRNPIDVIASWASLEIPVSFGNLPAANRYWPEMRSLTQSNIPLLDKQLLMLDLMFGRFLNFSEDVSIVRYEDMIRRPQMLWEAAGISDEFHIDHISIKVKEPSFYPELQERREILLKGGKLPNMERLYPC